MKKSYWKELCLLFIGFMIGYFMKYPTNIREHTITNIKDSLVIDTTYVYLKKIPDLNKQNVLTELKKQNIPHSDIVLRQSIHEGRWQIDTIMGSSIDVLKLQTCMNLFNKISPNDVFQKVLNAFF